MQSSPVLCRTQTAGGGGGYERSDQKMLTENSALRRWEHVGFGVGCAHTREKIIARTAAKPGVPATLLQHVRHNATLQGVAAKQYGLFG